MSKVEIWLVDPQIRAEQVQTLQRSLPESWALTNQSERAVVILTENVDITAEMVKSAPAVRIILKLDTGKARVTRTRIPVVAISNTGLVGVAEHVVTLILALSRHLLQVARQTAAAEWAEGKDKPILTSQKIYTYNWINLASSGAIYNKKVGIVGFGHIGRAVAERLRPFRVQLFYHDLTRFGSSVERKYGVEYRSLDALLAESDFVTLHLRFKEGEDGNENMFGRREFELMKPTAYFINTSRGRLVDENALIDALQSGRIAGAGLDVFHYEPLPRDHPLLKLAGDNVILTAHTAGSFNPEAWQTTANEIVERVRRLGR
jgi:phosphoglycerate dehydrogenase-like enzyme